MREVSLVAVLARCMLERRIGLGPVTETYAARLDGRRVVVRRLLPGADPALVERFDAASARLDQAAVLERSPGAMVREHLQGVNLGQLLEVLEGPPDMRLGLTLASAVCEALRVLHGKGVAHGHVCLENVIVSAAGEVVLTDAGLSPFALGAAPAAGTFAAPEQRAGGPSEAPGDVFGVATLVHLLAPHGLSAGLDHVLESALSPWAADRPGIGGLALALEVELSAPGGRAAPYEVGELVSERFPHPELPPPDMEPGREMVVEVASLSATGKVQPGRAPPRREEPMAAPPAFHSEVPLELDLPPPPAAPPLPAPQPRPFPTRIVASSLAVAVLVAGWFVLRPAPAPAPRASLPAAPADHGIDVVVFVDSTPDGASVFLGDEAMGTTPLTFGRRLPDDQPLELRIEKEGFVPVKRVERPEPGMHLRVNLRPR